MKKALFSFAVIVSSTALAQQQLSVEPTTEIVERGPHSQLLQRVTWSTNEDNEVIATTNVVTQIETGLNFRDPNSGEWLPSEDTIELLPGGTGAVARKAQHQIFFPPSLYNGVITLTTPEGTILRSRPAMLSYFDGQRSVLLAELTDSMGYLLPSGNEVMYPDTFSDGIHADIILTFTKSGFEADVVFRRPLPETPEQLGLRAESCRLQLLTEFFDTDAPVKESETISQTDGLADARLRFGSMTLIAGKAFSVPTAASDQPPVSVFKSWQVLENRSFLVEEVPYQKIESQLKLLAVGATPRVNTIASTDPNLRRVSARRLLPPSRLAQVTTKTLQFAKVDVRQKPGLVLDYVTINSSQTNYVFAGDKTFYVSGNVILTGTQTVFEAGCVFKFAPTNTPKLNITSPITWQGTMYRPVVMTARDDNTVGDTITGSTGNPNTNYYGNPALYIDAATAGTNAILQNLRIAYAQSAIAFDGGTGHVVSHAQLVNCANGFAATNTDFSLRNALLYNVLTNFNGSSSTGRCEHLTVDTANWMNHNSAITLNLTNSLLVLLTNTGSFTSNSVSTGTPGDFQTVGAAGHYLADSSPYRNVGTVNINATLLADLKQRTTYPPIVLTNNFTVNTTLSPQAQRDTDLPDLGFEYTPLDYVVSGRTLTNSTLTLTNGVALGSYGSSTSYGIYIRKSGNLVSEGSPTNLNQIVRYNTVQEQANTNWSATSVAHSVKVSTDGGTVPKGSFRFTGWSLLGGKGYHFYADYPNITTPFGFRECQFGPGSFYAAQCSVALTNCLLERPILNLDDDGGDYSYYGYNNLFRSGSLTLYKNSSAAWIFKDNLFDQSTISATTTITHGNNAYVSGYNRLTPTNATDVVLTNSPVYLTNYLGKYYYPTNDGMLSLLINAGSRNATNAGLYHFTVTTNEVAETISQVDIGFHYVATTNGVPIDTDSDGVPDYLEDVNGNGAVNSGETDWQSASDLGLRVLITRPKNNSILP